MRRQRGIGREKPEKYFFCYSVKEDEEKVSLIWVRVNLAWVAEETAVLLPGTALRCSREEKNDSWVRENLARAAGPTAVLYSYETNEKRKLSRPSQLRRDGKIANLFYSVQHLDSNYKGIFLVQFCATNTQ